MIDGSQLRTLVIKPALMDLVMFSEEALELLTFTCATESQGGTYLKQIKGPALGIFQMEPATYNDIWQNYINNHNDIKLKLLHNFNAPVMPDEERMIYDLRFATAMARIHYLRIPEPLPRLHDLDGLWDYYKKYYNTAAGKADYHGAMNAYQLFRNP